VASNRREKKTKKTITQRDSCGPDSTEEAEEEKLRQNFSRKGKKLANRGQRRKKERRAEKEIELSIQKKLARGRLTTEGKSF